MCKWFQTFISFDLGSLIQQPRRSSRHLLLWIKLIHKRIALVVNNQTNKMLIWCRCFRCSLTNKMSVSNWQTKCPYQIDKQNVRIKLTFLIDNSEKVRSVKGFLWYNSWRIDLLWNKIRVCVFNNNISCSCDQSCNLQKY